MKRENWKTWKAREFLDLHEPPKRKLVILPTRSVTDDKLSKVKDLIACASENLAVADYQIREAERLIHEHNEKRDVINDSR